MKLKCWELAVYYYNTLNFLKFVLTSWATLDNLRRIIWTIFILFLSFLWKIVDKQRSFLPIPSRRVSGLPLPSARLSSLISRGSSNPSLQKVPSKGKKKQPMFLNCFNLVWMRLDGLSSNYVLPCFKRWFDQYLTSIFSDMSNKCMVSSF